MIRSLLIVILIVAFLILSIPILIVEWIIGKFNPYARDISSLRIVQFMFKLILFVSGTKVTVIGSPYSRTTCAERINGLWASKIFLVLLIDIGMIGYPVFSAIFRLPSLNGRSSVSSDASLRVPSGKIHMETPFFI